MTRRAFAVVLLLAGSALAQIGSAGGQHVDMYPSPPDRVSASFDRPMEATQSYVSSARVSVSDLSIPARARKEFEKANESLRKQDLTHALRDLNKAVSICPQFADAYNNLGVVYERLGDVARERSALERAIEINDHLALAYRNLGRMDLLANDFAGGESELQKASAFDPHDPIALTLLAYAELVLGHLDDALARARQAHAVGAPDALAHRLAARVFELRKQAEAAVAELTLSLKEEPSGPFADSARKELEMMQAYVNRARGGPQ